MSYDQNLADCEVALADLATVVNDQSQKLNAANKLLEQTIEVLEGFPWNHTPAWSRNMGVHLVLWFDQQAKPLLDKLQALKKEGTE